MLEVSMNKIASEGVRSANPSTSAKPVVTRLQNLFVALVNMYIFQMTVH